MDIEICLFPTDANNLSGTTSSSMKKEDLPRPFVRPAKQEPSLPVNVHPLRPVASPARSASVPEVAKTEPVKMEAGANWALRPLNLR